MSDLDDLFPQESDSSDKMDLLASACERLQIGEEYIAKLEAKIAEMKTKLQGIEEIQIPEIMDAMKLKEFTLSNGRKISIKDSIFTSLSEENKPEGFKWLEDNGHGDLIKTSVSVQFNREEHEAANKLAMELIERQLSVTSKNDVHWATLRSFISGQLENGQEVPVDLFAVRLFRKAVLK